MTRESIIQLSEDLSRARYVSSLEEAISYTHEAMPEWGFETAPLILSTTKKNYANLCTLPFLLFSPQQKVYLGYDQT